MEKNVETGAFLATNLNCMGTFNHPDMGQGCGSWSFRRWSPAISIQNSFFKGPQSTALTASTLDSAPSSESSGP